MLLLLLQGLDIGPDSIKLFNDELKKCKTVVWNGPMGVFEFDKFAKGTIVSVSSHSAMSWLRSSALALQLHIIICIHRRC